MSRGRSRLRPSDSTRSVHGLATVGKKPCSFSSATPHNPHPSLPNPTASPVRPPSTHRTHRRPTPSYQILPLRPRRNPKPKDAHSKTTVGCSSSGDTHVQTRGYPRRVETRPQTLATVCPLPRPLRTAQEVSRSPLDAPLRPPRGHRSLGPDTSNFPLTPAPRDRHGGVLGVPGSLHSPLRHGGAWGGGGRVRRVEPDVSALKVLWGSTQGPWSPGPLHLARLPGPRPEPAAPPTPPAEAHASPAGPRVRGGGRGGLPFPSATGRASVGLGRRSRRPRRPAPGPSWPARLARAAVAPVHAPGRRARPEGARRER